MTPDALGGYLSLLPYWAFGLALAGSFYKGMVWLGGHFRPDFRQDLTDWLQGKRDKVWVENFCNLFDTLFGPRHVSWRRLWRSAAASVLAVLVLYVLFAHVLGVLGTRALGRLDLWQALGALVMVNIVADYVSLIETRWLLERFRRVRGVAGQAALLAADLVFTAAIVLLLLAAYGYLVLGAIPRPIEVLALFSVYSIFFYSTFLTSIWAWLYCASSWFVRLFTHAGLGRVFDVTQPVKQIALVGAALILLGTLALGPLIRAEEDGLASRLDRWLCERDLPSCFLAARASLAREDLGPTVMFMELACRDERDGDHCADRLSEFFGDHAQINAIWSRACEGGYPLACWAYGYSHQMGLGVRTDLSRAAELYEMACDGDNVWGCMNLGGLHMRGSGVEADPGRAMALFQKACDGGDVGGCSNLGTLYLTGRGVETDHVRAASLFRQGCDGGEAGGCANLGLMYERGRGVEIDLPRAASLYQRGCNGGEPTSCSRLGVFYELGHGVDEDHSRAVALYRLACDGGNAVGCSNLGGMYRAGRGVAEDFVQAVALYRQSCKGGAAVGCTNLGLMYEAGRGVAEDPAQAVELYRQGCDGGNALGCSYLGDMYEHGKGVPEDAARAAALYRQGCEMGDGWGCEALARITGD